MTNKERKAHYRLAEIYGVTKQEVDRALETDSEFNFFQTFEIDPPVITFSQPFVQSCLNARIRNIQKRAQTASESGEMMEAYKFTTLSQELIRLLDAVEWKGFKALNWLGWYNVREVVTYLINKSSNDEKKKVYQTYYDEISWILKKMA